MSFHDDIDPSHRNDPSGHAISARPQTGTVRVTLGPNGWQDGAPVSEAPASTGGMSVQIGGHTQRWNNGTGESSVTGPSSWNAFNDRPDPSRVGVAATLSTMNGRDGLAGGGTVEIPGFGTTNADTAVRLGYCRWVNGALVDVGSPQDQAATASAAPPQAKAAEDPGAAIYPASEDQALQAAVEPLQQSSYDSTMARVVSCVVHRDGDFTQAARQLAEAESSAGNRMDPSQANELIQDVVAYHERAAERAVAPMLGNDPARIAAFRDHLVQDKSRFEEALSNLVHRRDPAKFIEAAVQWKRANPGDLSQYTSQGFEVSMGPQGETLLRHPKMGGKWMDAAILAKL